MQPRGATSGVQHTALRVASAALPEFAHSGACGAESQGRGAAESAWTSEVQCSPLDDLKLVSLSNALLSCTQAARSRGRQRACRCPVAAGAAGAAGASGEGLAGGAGDPPLLARVDAFLSAFWKFLRPHTIRGTILGSCAVTARALIECPLVSPSSQLSLFDVQAGGYVGKRPPLARHREVQTARGSWH